MLRNILLFLLISTVVNAIEVKSYYGLYDVEQKVAGHAAKSLNSAVIEDWKFSKQSKPYKIAVLLPHLKDPYFLAVNYGILKQANKNGIKFKLYTAGGYNHLGDQRKQFHKAMKDGIDGIILASISYDKLDRDINYAKKQGIPVVEVINDIQAQEISAKSLVSFYQMGYKAGEFLAKHADSKKKSVAFLPGPKGSGWAPDTLDGFREAIEKHSNNNITIYKALYGDTGAKTQSTLIKRAFHYNKKIDYLVGNAVMAEVAPKILQQLSKKDTQVVSTYIIPKVYEMIKEGKVLAAPSDKGVLQARIAVDMLQKILDEKKPGKDFPFRTGPIIPVIDIDNIKTFTFESLFGKKDFKAVLSNY